MFYFLILVTLLLFGKVSSQNNPIVTINQGLVRGTENVTVFSGRHFYSFRGIPYAKPPIGKLRFQPPLPSDGWHNIYNATRDAPQCIQLNGGQEDCLYLNVYTPLLPSNASSLLPVMVFIHGGGFGLGSPSSNLAGPDYFMEKNVVLVLMAYRLGAFGFLSTGDAAAPGNYGLLDQALALQWVHHSIASFGGDPGRVLLFGQSAGAASVAFHIVANVRPSTGLFHAAITESGTALSDWAVQIDPLTWAVALGKQLKCPTKGTKLLIKCLLKENAEAIVNATTAVGANTIIRFAPVIEDPKYGNFITKSPIDILKNGKFNKVPIISGVTKDEGAFIYGALQQDFFPINDTVFEKAVPTLLSWVTNYKNVVNVSYAIKAEYFDKIDVNNETQVARAVIDCFTDVAFNSGNDIFVRAIAAKSVPVYMYVFEYAGFYSQYNYTGERDVAHAEDLIYQFYFGLPLNNDDRQISNAVINMWTNFATNLNPNPFGGATWIPTPKDSIQYLRIQTEFSMQDGYRTERMNFWNKYIPTIAYG